MVKYCAGGPLILKESSTLVGILMGGGVDCSRLGDGDYKVTETGHWMRVAAFRDWILDTVKRETRVGRKL